jgi:hypothetical protein
MEVRPEDRLKLIFPIAAVLIVFALWLLIAAVASWMFGAP